MILAVLNNMLAQTTGGAPAASGPAEMLRMMGPMLLMGVILYVILIRPSQKKAKEHALLLKTVKAGDKIVTTGGILGVIISVKDKSVSIRSADTKLEILKSSIGEILEKSAATAAE